MYPVGDELVLDVIRNQLDATEPDHLETWNKFFTDHEDMLVGYALSFAHCAGEFILKQEFEPDHSFDPCRPSSWHCQNTLVSAAFEPRYRSLRESYKRVDSADVIIRYSLPSGNWLDTFWRMGNSLLAATWDPDAGTLLASAGPITDYQADIENAIYDRKIGLNGLILRNTERWSS